MDEAAIRKKLSELSRILRACPVFEGGRSGSLDGVYVPQKGAVSPTVAEWLDHLGLELKYVVFDLEATRRENRYLRQMLESRPGGDRRGEPSEG